MFPSAVIFWTWSISSSCTDLSFWSCSTLTCRSKTTLFNAIYGGIKGSHISVTGSRTTYMDPSGLDTNPSSSVTAGYAVAFYTSGTDASIILDAEL